MLFSGVTWPKFAWMIAALVLAVRSPLSVATPQYSLPFALINSSRLTSACLSFKYNPKVVWAKANDRRASVARMFCRIGIGFVRRNSESSLI